MKKKTTAGERIADAAIGLPLDLKHELARPWLARRIDRAIKSAVTKAKADLIYQIFEIEKPAKKKGA